MRTALDKLIVKLADWLLYNQWDLEKEILATEYQGSSKWEKEYVVYRSSTDSFIERFLTDQDTHLNIVLTVRSAIFLLPSEYFDIYSMKYVEFKTINQIANMISVNEKTIRRKVMDIREHVWESLEEESFSLEAVARLREKYWYIPRKDRQIK